jgi:outer membrane autotransporter protein
MDVFLKTKTHSTMKKSLLLAMLFATLGAAPAVAAPYVSGSIGLGFPGDYTETESGTKYQTAFNLGVPVNAAVGYDFGTTRTEFAIGYQKYDVDTVTIDGTKYKASDYTDSADGSAWTFMANGYLDLSKGSDIEPYAMAGLGIASLKESAKASGITVSTNQSCFTWQLGAGLGFKLSKNLTGDFGYRYLKPTGMDNNGSMSMHNILAGVRYNF